MNMLPNPLEYSASPEDAEEEQEDFWQYSPELVDIASIRSIVAHPLDIEAELGQSPDEQERAEEEPDESDYEDY